jgi:hypothetical protein
MNKMMTKMNKRRKKKKKGVSWASSERLLAASRKHLKAHSISSTQGRKNNRERPQDQEASWLEGVHLS